jgi:hypothetical protein
MDGLGMGGEMTELPALALPASFDKPGERAVLAARPSCAALADEIAAAPKVKSLNTAAVPASRAQLPSRYGDDGDSDFVLILDPARSQPSASIGKALVRDIGPTVLHPWKERPHNGVVKYREARGVASAEEEWGERCRMRRSPCLQAG